MCQMIPETITRIFTYRWVLIMELFYQVFHSIIRISSLIKKTSKLAKSQIEREHFCKLDLISHNALKFILHNFFYDTIEEVDTVLPALEKYYYNRATFQK